MQGGSYYSKTRGAEVEINTMIDYHARNAFIKQLQLRVAELGHEIRTLTNTEFTDLFPSEFSAKLYEDKTLMDLLDHIKQCPNRVPKE